MAITIDPRMQPPGLSKEDMGKGAPSFAAIDGIQAIASDTGQATPTQDQEALTIDENVWLTKSKAAFDQSDDYFRTQVRGKLDDSIRAYHSQHASGSPFATNTKHFTSKIYRPKTRTLLTKYTAAATAAFFTNPDLVSIEAENPSDRNELVAAAVMKALLNYRLTKSIPWYRLVLGGFQDAMVQGLCCYHAYWDHKVHTDEETGQETTTVDKPCVDLIPIENVRFDAAASWVDVVNTSPYFIILRPMFVVQLREHIDSGYFNEVDEGLIRSASSKDGSTTRAARNNGKLDPQDKNTVTPDYEIVVVQEHIHRINGEDYVWHTLNNTAMLTDPKPIKEVYFHGKRPFVIGSVEVETHTAYVESQPSVMDAVQTEINEIANQRLNNLKLVMNKKYIIKSDSEVDLDALLRNQPGSAVYAENPKEDVVEMSTPDVTQTAYLESQYLDKDFDSLGGNFDPNVGMAGHGSNDRLGTMQMLNSNANAIVEYKLRTFTETAIQPLVRLLALLEQHYETDDVVLSLAGQNAKAFSAGQQVPVEILNKELNIKVNVGLNSTDPTYKLQKFSAVIDKLLAVSAAPGGRGFDMQEVAKELFGLSGYGDGLRFMNQQANPQVTMLQQQIAALAKKVADQERKDNIKLQIAREHVASRERIESMKIDTNNAKFVVDHSREMQAFEHNADMERKQSDMQLQQMQQTAQGQPPQGQPPKPVILRMYDC